jgi:hypothetical protein
LNQLNHIKGAILYNNGEWSALYDGRMTRPVAEREALEELEERRERER